MNNILTSVAVAAVVGMMVYHLLRATFSKDNEAAAVNSLLGLFWTGLLIWLAASVS